MKETRKQLDVVLHSATGLKSASKMAVYCVAWIDPIVRVPSPNTKAHGSHPEFNTSISILLDDRAVGRSPWLNIEILGHGLVSTRRVGFVRVSLSDLLQETATGVAEAHRQFNAHSVTRHSGRQQGFLSFDLHIRPASEDKLPKPANMSRRLTMESNPSKPRVITTLRQRFEEEGDNSDDVISPSSSSEDGHRHGDGNAQASGHENKVASRKRSYAPRPRSFSFSGCMSPSEPQSKPHAKQ